MSTTTLNATLREDMTTALKAKDALRLGTLRMALAAIQVESKAGTVERELSDDEVRKVLAREVKKRKEAAEAFSAGGRTDRAETELAEADILESYLPQQLSDDELAALVTTALEGVDRGLGQKAMGPAMKAANAAAAGRAEGARISAEVKKQLGL
jgi:uncharacterized protein YqeY